MLNIRDFIVRFVILLIIVLPIRMYSETNNFIANYYYDKLNENQLILKPDNRFFAEFYYDDDEGGAYSGFWWLNNDTLILLSDKISCNLYDIMKINKAELIKFHFIKDNNSLTLLYLQRFKNGKFVNIEFNRDEGVLLKHDANKLLLENTIETNILDTLIKKSKYWECLEGKFLFQIKNDLTIEFFDLQRKSKRYGYIIENPIINNEFYIILNNISIKYYIKYLEIEKVQYDKITLKFHQTYFTINKYQYVECFIGSESDYSRWYNYNNLDFIKKINSKIKKKRVRNEMKVFEINQDLFYKKMISID